MHHLLMYVLVDHVFFSYFHCCCRLIHGTSKTTGLKVWYLVCYLPGMYRKTRQFFLFTWVRVSKLSQRRIHKAHPTLKWSFLVKILWNFWATFSRISSSSWTKTGCQYDHKNQNSDIQEQEQEIRRSDKQCSMCAVCTSLSGMISDTW